jgi:hypothetical protein
MQTQLESLVTHVTQGFESCMNQILTASAETLQKQPAPDVLALENQQLFVQIADL